MKKEDIVALGVEEEVASKIEAAWAEELQAALVERQAEVNAVRIDAAVEVALGVARARNGKAVRALLDFEQISLGDDGRVSGLSEQIEKLKKAEDSGFLFQKEERGAVIRGAVPAEAGREEPDGRVDLTCMSYEELAAFLEEHPEFDS